MQWKKLYIDEAPHALEQSVKAASKLKRKLPQDIEMKTVPLMALSSSTEDVHVKTREVSQNIDIDIPEF